MQWKSLEAYTYFEANYVRQVKVCPLPESYILMAYANPRQGSSGLGWSGKTMKVVSLLYIAHVWQGKCTLLKMKRYNNTFEVYKSRV